MKFDSEGHLQITPEQLFRLAKDDPRRLIDHYLTLCTPAVFPTYDAYYGFLREISNRFEVHPRNLILRGSSKLGFSIAPNRNWAAPRIERFHLWRLVGTACALRIRFEGTSRGCAQETSSTSRETVPPSACLLAGAEPARSPVIRFPGRKCPFLDLARRAVRAGQQIRLYYQRKELPGNRMRPTSATILATPMDWSSMGRCSIWSARSDRIDELVLPSSRAAVL
jgi:hypothetical protein